MKVTRVWAVTAAVMVAAVAMAALEAGAATPKKEPPACSALSFRPVAPGMADGDQDAGLYKSRFVKIEIKAEVQGGAPKNYYMVINGKKADPMPNPPSVSESCLTSKNVKLPYAKQSPTACTGNRFRVVIDRTTMGKPTYVLFGLQGNAWTYCNATQA